MSPSYRFAPVKFVIPFAQLEIGEVFAAGAHGQVRKGSFAGKAVAIKQLLSVMFNPEQTEAFKKEAKMLCGIQHPNIVRFYGMSVDPSPKTGACYYLVTDLKDHDLRHLLNHERTISKKEVLRIACQICDPLDFLHSAGMVHRDLKPENILLDAELTVFLCDFGISKVYTPGQDKSSVHITTNIGTAAYMAPEVTSLNDFLTIQKPAVVSASSNNLSPEQQTQELACQHPMSMGEFDLSSTPLNPNLVRNKSSSRLQTIRDRAAKIDCYSFSIVLWALLSWQAPFPRMTPVQIMVAVSVYNKRPPTQSLEQGWGEGVVNIMKQLWSADPAARPSMADARSVLQSFMVS